MRPTDGREPARWPRVQFSWTWTVLRSDWFTAARRRGAARLGSARLGSMTKKAKGNNREWKKVAAEWCADPGRPPFDLFYLRRRRWSSTTRVRGWPPRDPRSAMRQLFYAPQCTVFYRRWHVSTVRSRTFYIRSSPSFSLVPDILEVSYHAPAFAKCIFFFRGIYGRKRASYVTRK